MPSNSQPVIVLHPFGEMPTDEGDVRTLMSTLTETSVEKFYESYNGRVLKSAIKFACSAIAGGTIAKKFGGLTPLGWALRGLSAFPKEYVSYRALPVLQFLPNGSLTQVYRGVGAFVGGNGARIYVAEMTVGQRLLFAGRIAGARFVLVSIAFEGGYMVGTLVNDHVLEDDSKNIIGGVINQVVNERGWRLAIPRVLRDAIGMGGLRD